MSKHTIVRKIDDLGRIVLPIEIRRILDIEEKDAMEISIEDDTVVLRKHKPTCIFCGASHTLSTYQEKRICADCMEELKSL